MNPMPTKNEWAKLKSQAQIASSPWYKRADAAVGPALAKVESARASWASKRDYQKAMEYVAALGKLDEAFDKFLSKKDLGSTAGQQLTAEIQKWKTYVTAKRSELEKKVPDLFKAYNEQFQKALDSIIP